MEISAFLDGYITTRELLELIREFYFDDDPASAGSWALGPLEPAHTTSSGRG